MNVLKDIFEVVILGVLPASAFILSIYQLFWKRKFRFFIVINLAIASLYGIATFLEGDQRGAIPDLVRMVFLFLYLPFHFTVSACCIALKHFLDKRKKTAETN